MSVKTSVKHTPGPWHVSGNGDEIVQPHPQATTEFAKGQGAIIARSVYEHEFVAGQRIPTDVTYANARLIAAAPDLLYALEAMNGVFKELAQILHSQGYRDFHEEMDWANAAIRKARGE